MRFVRTGEFGELALVRDMKPHTGIDYSMAEGTPIESVGSGIVEKIVNYGDANAGKTIIIQMDNGQQAIYGHLSEFKVTEGQHVEPGDLIALSGNTGNSTAPHLHFGIKEDGAFVDPSSYDPMIQQMGSGGESSWWNTPLWEKNIDTYQENTIGLWLSENVTDFIHWFLNVSPEFFLIAGMVACLGVIIGAPKSGKYATGFVITSVTLDIIRRSVMLT